MKKRLQNLGLLTLTAAAIAVTAFSVHAGGPVDEKLVVDDELEMTTRAASAEGHPLPEVVSGWHYRTPETRAMEADSFQNPGMLGVEQGEGILAAGEADHDLVAGFDHVEVGNRLSNLAAQAFCQLVGFEGCLLGLTGGGSGTQYGIHKWAVRPPSILITWPVT